MKKVVLLMLCVGQIATMKAPDGIGEFEIVTPRDKNPNYKERKKGFFETVGEGIHNWVSEGEKGTTTAAQPSGRQTITTSQPVSQPIEIAGTSSASVAGGTAADLSAEKAQAKSNVSFVNRIRLHFKKRNFKQISKEIKDIDAEIAGLEGQAKRPVSSRKTKLENEIERLNGDINRLEGTKMTLEERIKLQKPTVSTWEQTKALFRSSEYGTKGNYPGKEQ